VKLGKGFQNINPILRIPRIFYFYSYEPELHPGVTFRIKEPHRATLKIFSTGSITITGGEYK